MAEEVGTDVEDIITDVEYLTISGDLELIQELLERGVDVNSVNDFGDTVLISAAFQGDLQIVNYLLKTYPSVINVNYQPTKSPMGYTALISAVKQGHLEITKLLLENGARVDLSDNHGKTALMHAAIRGHIEIAKELLAYGADVFKKDQLDDFVKKTALDYATKHGHRDMVTLLAAAAGAGAGDATGAARVAAPGELLSSRTLRL